MKIMMVSEDEMVSAVIMQRVELAQGLADGLSRMERRGASNEAYLDGLMDGATAVAQALRARLPNQKSNNESA